MRLRAIFSRRRSFRRDFRFVFTKGFLTDVVMLNLLTKVAQDNLYGLRSEYWTVKRCLMYIEDHPTMRLIRGSNCLMCRCLYPHDFEPERR